MPKHSKTTSTNKKSLRENLLKIRNGIAGRAEKSAIIVEKLLARPELKQAHHILCYYPSSLEVDINPLIKRLLQQQKQLYLPHIDRELIGRFQDYSELESHRFGDIKIPNNSLASSDYQTIEVAIIPGLGFTGSGIRLGHGSGWYDRLLPLLNPNLFKIGVCFQEQIMTSLTQEKHDIRMDLVISN